MPALHVAVPALIAATIIGLRERRPSPVWLWLLYPITMTFATIYLGEHYVLDGVAGMALGALCYAAVRWGAQDTSTWAEGARPVEVSPVA